MFSSHKNIISSSKKREIQKFDLQQRVYCLSRPPGVNMAWPQEGPVFRIYKENVYILQLDKVSASVVNSVSKIIYFLLYEIFVYSENI